MPQNTTPASAGQPIAGGSAKQPPKAVKTETPEPAKEIAQKPDLSIEAIGWLFIQKYYNSYTHEIGKLYTLYDHNASILHENFPSENTESDNKRTKKVHIATGSESIQNFFDAQATSLEKNKIIIESANFQKSVDNSILIVVAGCWKRASSHLWHFVQTFVLRAKEETVYDVANDMLTFIDVVEDFKKETAIEVNKVEVEKAAEELAEPITSAQSQDAAGEQEEPESEAGPSVDEKSVAPQEEPSEERNDVEAVLASTETSQEFSEADESAPASPANEPKIEADPVPAQKPTWANLAAIGPKPSTKTATVATPNAAKISTPTPVAKKITPPAQAASAPANGRFRKEEWYPIYIKNIDVEEDELRAALVKQFGDIKFFKKTSKTALCDFKNKADQQKALEAKEIVVKTNVILLEPRIHKAYNAKPDYKKEKKQIKKNGFKKP